MNLVRLESLVGKENIEKIKNLKVLVLGLGGVGGYTVESLVRCGVENITLVDSDTIKPSNINRQIITTSKNMNKYKTREWKKRIKLINKNAIVNIINVHITEDNIECLFGSDYDYIIDACDTVTIKLELVKMALERGIKIISVMGTGNKFDPTMLEICDITKTSYDPLAKVMRKLLRDNKIKHLMVVASKEIPRKTDRIPGSSMMVPNTAGIYAAYYCINDIMENNKKCL